MTAGQEGKGKNRVSDSLNFGRFTVWIRNSVMSFPSCPAVILPWNKHSHTSKNSNSFIYHIFKGFYDRSILVKVKGVKLITLAMNNPVALEKFWNSVGRIKYSWPPERDKLAEAEVSKLNLPDECRHTVLGCKFTAHGLELIRAHECDCLYRGVLRFW